MTEEMICCIHGVNETFTVGESYKACAECWHVWQTEGDFRADVQEVYGTIPLHRVFCCPLCAHDF